MKRIIAITAAVLIIFAGCAQKNTGGESTQASETSKATESTAVVLSTEESAEHTETSCTQQTALSTPTSSPTSSSTAESRTEPKLTHTQASAVPTETATQAQTTLPTTAVHRTQKTTQSQTATQAPTQTQTESHGLNAVTPSQANTTETVTEDKKITVTVFCSCKNAVEYGIRNKEAYADLIPEDGILINTTVKVSPNSTALDAIKAACRQSGIEIDESRGYIRGIGGLYEKDCGGASGWLYSVNGSFPYTSSDKYVLKANDRIELHYTVKNGDVTRM